MKDVACTVVPIPGEPLASHRSGEGPPMPMSLLQHGVTRSRLEPTKDPGAKSRLKATL